MGHIAELEREIDDTLTKAKATRKGELWGEVARLEAKLALARRTLRDDAILEDNGSGQLCAIKSSDGETLFTFTPIAVSAAEVFGRFKTGLMALGDCDHKVWSFDSHGRCCPRCGVSQVKPGH